jgi:hypothetical protein
MTDGFTTMSPALSFPEVRCWFCQAWIVEPADLHWGPNLRARFCTACYVATPQEWNLDPGTSTAPSTEEPAP